jgi:hypothetical protein
LNQGWENIIFRRITLRNFVQFFTILLKFLCNNSHKPCVPQQSKLRVRGKFIQRFMGLPFYLELTSIFELHSQVISILQHRTTNRYNSIHLRSIEAIQKWTENPVGGPWTPQTPPLADFHNKTLFLCATKNNTLLLQFSMATVPDAFDRSVYHWAHYHMLLRCPDLLLVLERSVNGHWKQRHTVSGSTTLSETILRDNFVSQYSNWVTIIC